MKARVLSAILVVLLALPGIVAAETMTLAGPDLGNSIKGWWHLGLRITVLQDVVLRQFVFNNQGLPDVLYLEDAAGNVLAEYAYAGGDPLHQVIVEWPLVAGTTYFLVSQNSSNGRWASYREYPTANDHLQVDAAVGKGYQNTTFWFNFTALQTELVSTTLEVAVDIKPSDPGNRVNLRSRGKLPVAIYSDAFFDATTIDPASVEMAGAGVAATKRKLMAKPADLNEDGIVDLLVMFPTAELVPGLLPDGLATLTGVTFDGVNVAGTDILVPVPKAHK